MIAPVVFTWDGESMIPAHPRIADKQYVVHERYTLAPYEARSKQSHDHFFASVDSAWSNLPEDQAERFMTSEHLRKWALIKAGYADERSLVCASHAEALRVAAFIGHGDDYAIVTVKGATITEYKAKSQSLRAMGKVDFQDSKQKVLDIVSTMIGVDAGALSAHAKDAA